MLETLPSGTALLLYPLSYFKHHCLVNIGWSIQENMIVIYCIVGAQNNPLWQQYYLVKIYIHHMGRKIKKTKEK